MRRYGDIAVRSQSKDLHGQRIVWRRPFDMEWPDLARPFSPRPFVPLAPERLRLHDIAGLDMKYRFAFCERRIPYCWFEAMRLGSSACHASTNEDSRDQRSYNKPSKSYPLNHVPSPPFVLVTIHRP